MIKKRIGASSLGKPIYAEEFGDTQQVLIMGGVHGNEVEGVVAANALVAQSPNNTSIISVLNVDGYSQGSRLMQMELI